MPVPEIVGIAGKETVNETPHAGLSPAGPRPSQSRDYLNRTDKKNRGKPCWLLTRPKHLTVWKHYHQRASKPCELAQCGEREKLWEWWDGVPRYLSPQHADRLYMPDLRGLTVPFQTRVCSTSPCQGPSERSGIKFKLTDLKWGTGVGYPRFLGKRSVGCNLAVLPCKSLKNLLPKREIGLAVNRKYGVCDWVTNRVTKICGREIPPKIFPVLSLNSSKCIPLPP